MLFNSYIFIFVFLPVVLVVYFVLNRYRLTIASIIWLVLASLFFYGWWDIKYVPLIIASVLFNYVVSGLIIDKMHRCNIASKKVFFIFGLLANLTLLGYFKYRDIYWHRKFCCWDTAGFALHCIAVGYQFFYDYSNCFSD